MSTASAGSQAGTVVVKVSGTTTSRITTPAVTASSNYVTTTAGKTTTSKQVGTPAVVATNSVKTTNTGASATRITTPAVVAGNVTTTGTAGNTKRVGTPAVTTYATTSGTSRTLSTPAVTHDVASLQAARSKLTKNLTAPEAPESNFMDGVHIALDVAGFIPGVGTLADLANGVIYAAEGDWVNAGISTAAIFFDAATGARLVTNAAQNVIGTTMTRVVREGAEETVERVGRETAENVAERIGRGVGESGTELLENIGEVRYRDGIIVDPMEVTYEMRLNPEGYAYAVADKYGINLRGSGQQINIIFDPNHIKGPGVSRELDPTNIILGPKAFIDEEELARTIAHELNHARSWLKGGCAPEDTARAAEDALGAFINGGR